MNEDSNGNRKLFWKSVRNAKGGKVESCSRIKDGNESLAQGRTKRERSGRSILKICIIWILRNRLQSTCVALIGFGEVTTSEESQLEELRFEVRVGKFKNGKAVGKDEITREMIKGGFDRVVDWIWRLCNMAF